MRQKMMEKFEMSDTIQLLDDAGRAAIKVGDEVLVRVRVAAKPDSDGEIEGEMHGVRAPRSSLPPYFLPSAVFALIPNTTRDVIDDIAAADSFEDLKQAMLRLARQQKEPT